MWDEERSLRQDQRLHLAVDLFNSGDWYGAHDLFEELWHETQGPSRPALQAVLQISVSQLHLERGNHHGATVLLGEGIGRLAHVDDDALGLDFLALKKMAMELLHRLQQKPSILQCSPLQLCAARVQ